MKTPHDFPGFERNNLLQQSLGYLDTFSLDIKAVYFPHLSLFPAEEGPWILSRFAGQLRTRIFPPHIEPRFQYRRCGCALDAQGYTSESASKLGPFFHLSLLGVQPASPLPFPLNMAISHSLLRLHHKCYLWVPSQSVPSLCNRHFQCHVLPGAYSLTDAQTTPIGIIPVLFRFQPQFARETKFHC